MSGLPATGKSTMFRALLLAGSPRRAIGYGLVRGQLMSYAGKQLVVLGVYSDPQEVFPGTDRLSMGVVPALIRYLETAPVDYPWPLMWEGDRLASMKVWHALEDHPEIEPRFVRLSAPPEVLEERRAARPGKPQSPSWLRGRETKLANLCEQFPVEQHSPADLPELLALGAELLNWTLRVDPEPT